jgi:hypothetical protein
MDRSEVRSEVISTIRKALKERTGRPWSVKGGRGTGWGWIDVQAPPRRRIGHVENPNFSPWDNPVGNTEKPYLEVEPDEDHGAWYTSNEDQELLREALGVTNMVGPQGLTVSPDSWEFYVDRAVNGPPPPEPIEEIPLEFIPLPEMPEIKKDQVKEVKTEKLVEGRFPRINKNSHLEEYTRQLDNEDDYHPERCKIVKIVTLNPTDYDDFVNGNLLTDAWWLAGEGGADSTAEGLPDVEHFWELTEEQQELWKGHSFLLAVKVIAQDRQSLYINPEGHRYARYVGFPVEQETIGEEEPKQDKPKQDVMQNLAHPAEKVLGILKDSGVEVVEAMRLIVATQSL